MNPRIAVCCTALICLSTSAAVAQRPDQPALRSVTVMTIRYLSAFKQRDVNLMGREMTKDFSWRRLDGETLRGSEALAHMKALIDRATQLGTYSLSFENIREESDDVAIDGKATLIRTIKNEDGTSTREATTTISKYLWTRTLKGWRIRRIHDIRQETRPVAGPGASSLTPPRAR